MYFDDNFINSLPEDIPSVISAICEKFFDSAQGLSPNNLATLIKESFGFIAAYSETNSLHIEVPAIVGNIETNMENASKFFKKQQVQASQEIGRSEFEQYKNLFATRFGKVFHYEFSEGDLKLIQELINELRGLISTTEELEEGHKHRLIKKLEKVQSELHKRVSDLDRFWGFCVDLSLVVGIMGENAKPTVGLVKKIVDIIWPAQTRAYELSSSLPFKMLGQAEDDKSENGKS